MSEEQKETSFEEALARLEQIVAMLEQGQLSLEESMARFEEGTALGKICSRKLAEAQEKIERLTRRQDGTMEWTEMAPPPEGYPQE